MLTGNGSSLSQGQRQLISIARAAVADPPAMILDEATSSIDTRTEALVQGGMDNLMSGRRPKRYLWKATWKYGMMMTGKKNEKEDKTYGRKKNVANRK